MDFNQNKLTKTEWNSIEKPISIQEKNVCNLITNGFKMLILVLINHYH